MTRTLVPELLDSLPPDHPGAVAGRRDLRRINAVMGNHRWLRARLAALPAGEGPVVEIGAGDGTLARKVCAAMPGLAARYYALDLAPCPPDWPAGATWHQADLWSEAARALLAGARVVVANLVLHHFQDEELRRLGGLLSSCRYFLAREPLRRELHVWQGRLIFPFIHPVTRHDMVVSIHAGFRDGELAEALGLDSGEWRFEASGTWLGAYSFTAIRKDA